VWHIVLNRIEKYVNKQYLNENYFFPNSKFNVSRCVPDSQSVVHTSLIAFSFMQSHTTCAFVSICFKAAGVKSK